MTKHYHRPLVKDMMFYYNLATVKVVEQAIIVLIPFDGSESFKLMTVYPFPVFLNNTFIIWNHDPLHLLFHNWGATIITLKKDLFFQTVEDNILIFSNKTLHVTIICEDRTQQVEVIDVKAISSKSKIRIPDQLTYIPTK